MANFNPENDLCVISGRLLSQTSKSDSWRPVFIRGRLAALQEFQRTTPGAIDAAWRGTDGVRGFAEGKYNSLTLTDRRLDVIKPEEIK